jgi:hypothetical protein
MELMLSTNNFHITLREKHSIPTTHWLHKIFKTLKNGVSTRLDFTLHGKDFNLNSYHIIIPTFQS